MGDPRVQDTSEVKVRLCARSVGCFWGEKAVHSSLLSVRPVILHCPFPKHITSCPEDGWVGGRPRVWPRSLSFSSLLKMKGSDSAGVFPASGPNLETCVQHIFGARQGFPTKPLLLLKVDKLCFWVKPECHHCSSVVEASSMPGSECQPDIDQRVSGLRIGEDWHSTPVPGTR
jgi:hypothetical protein